MVKYFASKTNDESQGIEEERDAQGPAGAESAQTHGVLIEEESKSPSSLPQFGLLIKDSKSEKDV